LCYLLGFVTGVLFLILEPRNRYVRFHAIQSVLFFGTLFVLRWILFFIPYYGIMASVILALLGLFVWIFMMVKAYGGEMYKLPFVGEIAANALR